MSKRYGRNQRRAHRNRIAALEAHGAKLQRDYNGMWRAARDLRDEIDTAKKIVGEYCVAFEPRTVTLHWRSQDYVTVMEYEREHGIGVHRFLDFDLHGAITRPMSIQQIRLPIMCVLASQEIKAARHVFVAYDGHTYAYAISPLAWMQARYPRMLAQQVSERLTTFIYEELSKTMREQMRPDRSHTRDESEPRDYTPQFRFSGA